METYDHSAPKCRVCIIKFVPYLIILDTEYCEFFRAELSTLTWHQIMTLQAAESWVIDTSPARFLITCTWYIPWYVLHVCLSCRKLPGDCPLPGSSGRWNLYRSSRILQSILSVNTVSVRLRTTAAAAAAAACTWPVQQGEQ